jgi:hypothetical protein
MNDNISQYFTGIEAEKRKALVALMSEWHDSLPREDYYEWFTADGFFPKYYNQNKKPKVLFVGREPRWVIASGDYDDYIAFLLDGFKKDNQNKSIFWRRILQMVQLFKSDGKIEFELMSGTNERCADKYAKEMGKTGDYGFAVMNISKYCNDTDEGASADMDSIYQFLEDSQLEKRNYFQEELKILDPEYIITGNLLDWKIEKKYLGLCFGKLTKLGEYPQGSPDGILYEMDLDGKKIKLVDVYHFSDRTRSDKEYFYTPIKELLFSDREK